MECCLKRSKMVFLAAVLILLVGCESKDTKKSAQPVTQALEPSIEHRETMTVSLSTESKEPTTVAAPISERSFRKCFVTPASRAASQVQLWENIWHGDKVIGWVTSGGYAHYVDKSLAQGYVPKEFAGDTKKGAFEVEILGERRPATIITEPLFDPEGARMRM